MLRRAAELCVLLIALVPFAATAQPDPPYVESPPTPTGFRASADFEAIPTPDFVAERWTAAASAVQEAEAWALVPEIVARIEQPRIPDRDCLVTDHGASADSTGADDRPGILAALDACADAGGGRVVLPPGDWLSNGPIHFRDRIALHLEAGATLRFGTDPAMYTPLVRSFWEGTELYNYSPLLYADGAQDIAITGRGVIDGQTQQYWTRWKDMDAPRAERLQETAGNKPLIRQLGGDQVPIAQRIFGGGVFDVDGDGVNDGDGVPRYLRPSLVQFIESERVLIEGVTLKNSPFWTVHPVLCEHVTVRGVTIRHGTTNDDGIDPENSRYVLIEDNDIHTDDDPIALKAGRDADGRRRPSTAFVVIRNNRLRSTLGGAMSIGSEMAGGVEWVFIDGNVGTNTNGRGLYLKSNLDRGGFIRHVYVRDLDLMGAETAFEVTTDYKGWRGGQFPTAIHDLFLSDVRVWAASEHAVRLLGQDAAPIRRVRLDGLHIRGDGLTLPAPELRAAEQILTREVVLDGTTWTPTSDDS